MGRGTTRELTDDAEVLVQSVPDEDTSKVDQQSQLLVGHLEGYESVSRDERIQITR
jgi:hypothetical protein